MRTNVSFNWFHWFTLLLLIKRSRRSKRYISHHIWQHRWPLFGGFIWILVILFNVFVTRYNCKRFYLDIYHIMVSNIMNIWWNLLLKVVATVAIVMRVCISPNTYQHIAPVDWIDLQVIATLHLINSFYVVLVQYNFFDFWDISRLLLETMLNCHQVQRFYYSTNMSNTLPTMETIKMTT